MKIINNRSVAILMATYNGASFLDEQIKSIQNQTFKDWTLYIQDDGSKDGTLDIVRSYVKLDHRINLVDVGLSRQGAGMNFMSLLNIIESQYYMFCDQDDVWFNNKIEISFNRMLEEEKKFPNKPIIVHTDRTHTDAELNIILKSEFNPKNISLDKIQRKIDGLKNLNILRIYTIVGGCTMLFNYKVKQSAFPFINARVHDSICAMATISKGGIISTILDPTMYYRLHGNNTCGVSDGNLIPKFLHIFSSIAKNMRGFHIWKIYGGGNFFKFLYWRIRYFLILRLN